MQVHNVHEREFDLSLASVGSLIDSLASSNDRLWPNDKWPPMRFDRALAVGARGGHGPIRYSIEEYQPSRLVVFRFLAPRGFDGTHRYEVAEQQGRTVLRHVLEMHTTDLASLSWPLLPTTTRCVNRRQFGQSSCFAGECSSERGALVDFRASAPSRSQDASQSTLERVVGRVTANSD